MGFFDREERERAIKERMDEMEEAARQRQEAAVRQAEADVSAVQRKEQEAAAQPEVAPEPPQLPGTPLEDIPYEESYVKAPEDEAPEAVAKKAPKKDPKKAPKKDRWNNLAGLSALFKYGRGKGTGLEAAAGVAESVAATWEDAFQAAEAHREHSKTQEGQEKIKSLERAGVYKHFPAARLLRNIRIAADLYEAAPALGEKISDYARGKSEEAYGGAAQKAKGEEAEAEAASAYAYAHPDGTPIGSISQGSESGEDGKPLKLSSTGLGGIDAISFGRGDPGGKSYGRHQLMTRMIKDKNGKLVRTGNYDPAKSGMAGFLQSKEAKPFSKEILASLKGADGTVNWDLLGSDKFDAAWTKVTTGKGRDAWGAAQSNYLGRTHLKPNIDYLNKKYKGNEDIALLLTNEGFLEAIYSGGIQYGATGARKRLIMPALAQAEKENKLGDAAHVIELLYARRKSTGHARPSEKKQVLEMARS